MPFFNQHFFIYNLVLVFEAYCVLQSCWKLSFFTWCTFPSTPIESPLILPKIILQSMYFESDNLFHIIYFIFYCSLNLASIWIGSTMTQSTSTSKIWPKLAPKARTWIDIWSEKTYLCLNFFDKSNGNMVMTSDKHNA